MAHSIETLRELFKIAEETHKFGKKDSALISSIIKTMKNKSKPKETKTDKERFQKLLHTPYGL